MNGDPSFACLSSRHRLLSALAFAFLVAGLMARDDGGTGMLFRVHDALAACASIAICLVAASWKSAPARHGGNIGTTLAAFGAVSAAITAATLSLVFLTGASDMLYMLPQGGIGLWLMATCLEQPTGVSRPLGILGFVSGLGLLLVGGSFLAIAAAQGPELWALRNQTLGDPDPAVQASPLNVVGHQVLSLGTLLGVTTFPIWAISTARSLRAVPPQTGGVHGSAWNRDHSVRKRCRHFGRLVAAAAATRKLMTAVPFFPAAPPSAGRCSPRSSGSPVHTARPASRCL